MLESLANALRIPDLRNKLLFTLGMLVVFRFIAHVPVPGVDTFRLEQLFQQSQLLGMLDLFSGGAMQNFSIAAMGVYPYITATIIMQLLVPIIPQLEELSKEGEAGRQRITTITHWLMVPLAMLQAYATSVLLQSQGIIANIGLGPGQLLPTASIIVSMTAGTALLVWLGELITENGIGNGVSIIIFAGIVSQLPLMVGRTLFGGGDIGAGLVFAVLGLVIIAAIVFVQESQRRIPVHYAKRVRGTRVYGGQSTHIPLRVNSAGMIPIIFAMSLMLFPGDRSQLLHGGNGIRWRGCDVHSRSFRHDPHLVLGTVLPAGGVLCVLLHLGDISTAAPGRESPEARRIRTRDPAGKTDSTVFEWRSISHNLARRHFPWRNRDIAILHAGIWIVVGVE